MILFFLLFNRLPNTPVRLFAGAFKKSQPDNSTVAKNAKKILPEMPNEPHETSATVQLAFYRIS